jgi:hypothetical protein
MKRNGTRNYKSGLSTKWCNVMFFYPIDEPTEHTDIITEMILYNDYSHNKFASATLKHHYGITVWSWNTLIINIADGVLKWQKVL